MTQEPSTTRTPLLLISLNIEGSKHLEKVIPFIQTEPADVICLQELVQTDIPALEEAIGAWCTFAPMLNAEVEGQVRTVGIGIFSRLPVRNSSINYYVDHRENGLLFDKTNFETKFNTASFAVVSVTVEKDGSTYTIFTTHFPVTDNGQTTHFQLEALQSLFSTLQHSESFILCGDLNAPRGGEIFSTFAEKYTDHIPLEYTSSLDPYLHRAAPLELMVDGLFTTNDHHAPSVAFQCGLSDHCAILASLSKPREA